MGCEQAKGNTLEEPFWAARSANLYSLREGISFMVDNNDCTIYTQANTIWYSGTVHANVRTDRLAKLAV
jgi:hypothetical protein